MAIIKSTADVASTEFRANQAAMRALVEELRQTRAQSFGRHFDYGIGAGAFAAKAIRMGDANGWRILRRRLFRDGFGAAFRHLIKREEHAALAEQLRPAPPVPAF